MKTGELVYGIGQRNAGVRVYGFWNYMMARRTFRFRMINL